MNPSATPRTAQALGVFQSAESAIDTGISANPDYEQTPWASG
jgi:hypothetical protein